MRILVLGDVVGSFGCEMVRRHLSHIKKEHAVDLTIINGENSADGNGITPHSAEHLFTSGVDVITGGNHSFRRREIYPLYEEAPFLLRPANYPASAPGKGMCIIDKGYVKVAVINLMGLVYLSPLACPFETAERLIDQAKEEGASIILVDFHAEATGEKKAMGFYLDGRVTAVIGTHTHIPTADEQILPQGTGYITDIGMTGPWLSVLGVKSEQSIAMLKDKLPVRFENAAGDIVAGGCLLEIDNRSAKTERIERMEWVFAKE